ncbi:MAG: hypothetical protein JW957_02620 [Candidatus Omnitrophica bacterium]|nr:hypothetical protein [Candidatus Omnitrophota bacterium]
MKFNKTLILISAIGLLLSGCFINPSLSAGMKKSSEGDRLFSSGNLDGAVEKWTEALDYKQSANLYEKIITALVLKNDLSEAEEWTQKGLTYFPNNVNLAFNLALMRFYKEDLAGSMDALEAILGINAYYPNAHFLKGLIHEKEGDGASAKKEFIAEVNINPGSRRAWQKLRGFKND